MPTTVLHVMSGAPFNPFRSFADEEISTGGVSPPQAGVGGVDSNLPDPRPLASATKQPEPLTQTPGLRSLCVFHVELEPSSLPAGAFITAGVTGPGPPLLCSVLHVLSAPGLWKALRCSSGMSPSDSSFWSSR